MRPQAPLLNSLYSQSVKSWRPVKDMEGFVARELELGPPPLQPHLRPPARQQQRKMSSLRPFNRETLASGLTADMCKVMGFDGQRRSRCARGGGQRGPRPQDRHLQRLRRRATNNSAARAKRWRR